MTSQERFSRWLCDDQEAVRFAHVLFDAAQLWDDLEDEKHVNHALLSWLGFGMEYDPYFQKNGHILRPVMLSMYLQWRASNVLDRGSRHDVEKSYMLRAAIYQVWHVMAWIAGGDDWAAKVGPEIYRFYSETVDDIWQEFNPETENA